MLSGCSLFDKGEVEEIEVISATDKMEKIIELQKNNPLLNTIAEGIVKGCESHGLDEGDIAYCKEMILANEIIAEKDKLRCESLKDVNVRVYCNESFISRDLSPNKKSVDGCMKNCSCAKNECDWAECSDECGGECQGKIKPKGDGSCQAEIAVECGDPYENDGKFRENWAGEWDQFDRIVDLDWDRIRDEEWCEIVGGKSETIDAPECRIIECRKTLKCTGSECTKGDGSLCKVENDKFVWESAHRRDWCLPAEYGDPNQADPEVVCNDKCQKETILALFDNLDPIVTLEDEEGRPIAKATEDEQGSEPVRQSDIFWYHKSVPVLPVCEDVDPQKTSIYVLCDRAGQGCDIESQYASETTCIDSKKENQLCKEIRPYKSGCGLSGGPRSVHGHMGTVKVNHQDRAGNKGKASNVPLYIDHNMPDIGTLKVKITTIDFANGDAEMELFPNPDTENEKLVAHDKYKISIQLEDSSCLTEDCEERGYASGISGIDWERSEIILRDRADSFSIKLNSMGAGSLINFSFGLGRNENFVFQKTTKSNFVPDTANFLETAELTFSGDIFKKAGRKSLDFIFRDKAGNILNTANEEKTIFLEIGPGTASKIGLDTPACEQSLANNSDVCNVKIALWDKYENPVTSRKVRFVKTIGQDVDGSYDVFADPQQAFVNGIRMTEIETKSRPGRDDFVAFLPIRAMVPSLYLKTARIGDDDIIYVEEEYENVFNGLGGGERTVYLVLEVENVNGASKPINEYTLFDKNTDVNLTFLPWVYLKMTDNPDC